jgi:hypothetical protein
MFDLRKIPVIMRAQSPAWNTAAALQDIWFSRQAHVYPASGAPRGPPDTGTVTMDWLLGFARAKAVYDFKVVAAEYWKTPKAEASLRDWLFKSGRLQGGAKRFGDLGRAVPVQDADYYQSMSVPTNLFADPLDDLFGALGDYNLRFVAAGRVAPLDYTDWLVTVEQVGVYVQDKFDFNGFQPLGYWNPSTNQVSKLGGLGDSVDRLKRDIALSPWPVVQRLAEATDQGAFLVSNADYRDWRAKHGKGGDFQLFSDLKIIAQAKPWSFHASGAIGTHATPVPPAFERPSPFRRADAGGPPPVLGLVVVPGDTLSGLAARHYGDWQFWPLIWDQNRAAIGPLPSTLKVGTLLRLAPLAGFAPVQQDAARRRAPKWKNSEFA